MPSVKAKPPSPAPHIVLLLLAASFGTSQAWVNCEAAGSSAASAPPEPSPTSSTTANSSAFRANVLALLDALPDATAPTGFASLSRGAGRDHGLCRGDSNRSVCLAGMQDAARDLSGRCASSRGVGAWHGECYISYADTDDSAVYEGRIEQIIYDAGKVADPDSYDTAYYALMSRLVARAAAGGNRSARTSMFATGEAVYARDDPIGTMYGLVRAVPADAGAAAADAQPRTAGRGGAGLQLPPSGPGVHLLRPSARRAASGPGSSASVSTGCFIPAGALVAVPRRKIRKGKVVKTCGPCCSHAFNRNTTARRARLCLREEEEEQETTRWC